MKMGRKQHERGMEGNKADYRGETAPGQVCPEQTNLISTTGLMTLPVQLMALPFPPLERPTPTHHRLLTALPSTPRTAINLIC